LCSIVKNVQLSRLQANLSATCNMSSELAQLPLPLPQLAQLPLPLPQLAQLPLPLPQLAQLPLPLPQLLICHLCSIQFNIHDKKVIYT
jgi:hypothetical protein